MANLDLEEQEQLDQLKNFWQQYGNLISGVLIVVLAAVAGWNFVSSVGAFIAGFGVLVFLAMLAEAFARKRVAGDNPWGPYATTLEWTLSSPPPFHQFNELPKIQ